MDKTVLATGKARVLLFGFMLGMPYALCGMFGNKGEDGAEI